MLAATFALAAYDWPLVLDSKTGVSVVNAWRAVSQAA